MRDEERGTAQALAALSCLFTFSADFQGPAGMWLPFPLTCKLQTKHLIVSDRAYRSY